MDVPSLSITPTGATGSVGETNHGGAPTNQGFTITPDRQPRPGRHRPTRYTIPPRTPFALTGSATDPDSNPLTYMWEQVDPAGIQGVSTAGTQLFSQTKTNGVSFRQLGVTADISPTDTLLYNSPGLNLAGTNPTRTFPDMLQILSGNTNAKTGRCEADRSRLRPARRRSWSRVTSASASRSSCRPASGGGFLDDKAMTFRMTVRDGIAAGGGIGFGETKVTVATAASPFQVTSQGVPQVIFGTTSRTSRGTSRARTWRRSTRRRSRSRCRPTAA